MKYLPFVCQIAPWLVPRHWFFSFVKFVTMESMTWLDNNTLFSFVLYLYSINAELVFFFLLSNTFFLCADVCVYFFQRKTNNDCLFRAKWKESKIFSAFDTKIHNNEWMSSIITGRQCIDDDDDDDNETHTHRILRSIWLSDHYCSHPKSEKTVKMR